MLLINVLRPPTMITITIARQASKKAAEARAHKPARPSATTTRHFLAPQCPQYGSKNSGVKRLLPSLPFPSRHKQPSKQCHTGHVMSVRLSCRHMV